MSGIPMNEKQVKLQIPFLDKEATNEIVTVRNLRKKYDLSAEDLCSMTGIARTTLSRLENPMNLSLVSLRNNMSRLLTVFTKEELEYVRDAWIEETGRRKRSPEEELIYKVLKDVIISVSDDGEIEFEDTEWAKPDESEEEGVGDSYFAHNLWDLFDFGFVTTEDVIYDAKKLITAYVPYKSGKYKINGELNMTYNLSNLLVYNSDTTSTIEYVDKDAIEVDFNLSNSYVENFDYEEI